VFTASGKLVAPIGDLLLKDFKWSGQDGRFRNHRGNYMNSISKALLAAAGIAALAWSPAQANEGAGAQTKAGVLIGASAGVPPPGIYMINQVFTYQANLTGPGTPLPGSNGHTGEHVNVDVQAFLFVPGWTFIGASVDFVIAQPFVDVSVGAPANVQASGVHNTVFIGELAWQNIAHSGFAFKTGLSIITPDGTITGINGLGNIGSPYWTFQPEAIFSYLKDGWNLTAAVYDEINTANSITDYTSGNILHADFTATKTIGKWTIGPVAYYYGQVTNDKCSSATCLGFYPTGTLLNAQKFNVWAVGGLVAYDFGPAALSVWATQEISAKTSNAAAAAALGADPSNISQGMTVFATLSYRIWGPEEAPKPAMFHK
jgi:hypothetical protein